MSDLQLDKPMELDDDRLCERCNGWFNEVSHSETDTYVPTNGWDALRTLFHVLGALGVVAIFVTFLMLTDPIYENYVPKFLVHR